MRISQKGVDLIKHYEGFRSTPYYCSAGKLTIGYGHVILAHELETLKKVTKEEAERILKKDIFQAEVGVARLVRVPLKQYQYDALVSFVFNLGALRLEGSTLLVRVNQKDHAEAAEEFKRWVYAGGKKVKGLILRREVESAIYQYGYKE